MRAPTYAEATSTVALFLALGGVSWAATSLPKSSVTSSAIRDGQVQNADLAAGSVSAKKLSKALRAQLGVTSGTSGSDGTSGANGTSGASGTNGTSGANGTAGAAGPQGPAGRDGAGLIASVDLGSHLLNFGSFTKVGELSWTQPAHALDDIRGTYTVGNTTCGPGGGVAYQLVVDGREISYDIGNVGVTNTANSNNPEAMLTVPGVGQSAQDSGSFGSELPVVGGAAPATHKLVVNMRVYNCQAVTMSALSLYVTRYAAG